MLPPPPSAHAVVSRRGLLLGGAGLVAAAGCSTSRSEPEHDAPSGTARLAPDVAVATAALERIRGQRAAVDATAARYPALRAALADVTAMHTAHEGSLVDAVPERARPDVPPAPYAVPRRRAAAARKLARAEESLHAALDALALRAESGAFARLLACMGAGIAQQLGRWPS